MTIVIPQKNWQEFLLDLGLRRSDWEAHLKKNSVDAYLKPTSPGRKLNFIRAEQREEEFIVEVSLGDEAESHSIRNPVRIVYFVKQGHSGGAIEFHETDGTKTLVRIEKPISYGYNGIGSSAAQSAVR